MSRYLNLVGALSRTPCNDLLAYLALAVAAAALPGAALFYVVLSALAQLRRLLPAGADQLGGLLHSGRVRLAGRLRQAADLFDPRPADDNPSAPAAPPTVEEAPEPACVPVAQAVAVPVPMPAAAQVTVEAPAVEESDQGTDAERERLAAALAEHGSIRAAARSLGIGESTLRGRLNRQGIEAPKRRRGRKARAATAA